MVPKKNRLTKKEFNTVFKEGRREHGSSIIVYTKSAPGHCQVAVSVPQKVTKKAADRNRIRRAVYREIQSVLGGIKDKQVIVVLKKFDENVDLSTELSLLKKNPPNSSMVCAAQATEVVHRNSP